MKGAICNMNDEEKEKNYYMPAEWEKHKATWLQWPHEDSWEKYQMKLEGIWLQIVEILQSSEEINILVQDDKRKEHVIHQLNFYGIGTKGINIITCETNDVWIRDNGPIFVLSEDKKEIAITDWKFNGWGNRYDYELDNKVPAVIGKYENIPVYSIPMVLEGGSVEVNGKGTFIATETSIINLNRNPKLSKNEIEQYIMKYLGVKKIIWLSGMNTEDIGVGWSDDTDTHIDLAARFVDDNTILYPSSDDEEPRFDLFKKHLEELLCEKTESGKHLDLVALPVPAGGVYSTSRIGAGGGILTTSKPNYTNASYTNFYISNRAVLVPVFGNKNDENALKIIREHFPKRDVIGINCTSLVENGGMLHCITQQQPIVQSK
jgi:agmatine deiminase